MAWNVWNVDSGEWAYLQSGTKARAEELMGISRSEAPAVTFEVRRIGDVMENHGTKLMQLKPSMIWRCAMDDMDRRAHNKNTDVAGMKQYAFHRKHVAKANTANDIIRAAIAQPGLGQSSSKKDTRLLYSDVELLKAALQ